MPLKVSHGIGAWIKDFQKSDAPQFKGKSDKERRDQAIAAYLSAKRDQKEAKEPPPFEGPYKKKKSVVPGKHGEGPSTAKHLAKMGMKQAEKKPMKEVTTFEVDIEGLPKMYIKDKSPGAVKAKLRGIVKQPSMIQGVDRVTDAAMKKTYRDKAQGRDEVEEGTGKIDELKKSTLGSYIKKAHQSKSFTAADIGRMGSRSDTPSDEYKKVKDKHKNRSIGIDRAVDRMTKEEVNEISGELAQRYHDKAVKAPAPKDKKDPLKHTLKRFASMQKAQDIIHKSELKRIGGQK